MNIKEFAGKFIKAQEQAWHNGNFDALEKLEDPKIVIHFIALNQEVTGFEAHKQIIIGYRQAAPGVRVDWKYVTGDGNVFSVIFNTSGSKFTGTVPGFPPPTGKEIISSSLFVCRLNKGMIVEAWSYGTITGLT